MRLLVALVVSCLPLVAVSATAASTPTPVPELVADHLALAADYDPAIPTQAALLGFAPGDQVATPAELVSAFASWAAASGRAEVEEYGRSHEGRPLQTLVISSPANIARLAEIKSGMAKLADPRGVDAAERQRLVDELPGVAWIGYSIHGNETSGSDAALAVAYHLIADRSAATSTLLDRLVVLLDPTENPDGRARFGHQLMEHRGAQPNLDPQSTHHGGYWPFGRGNHFLFDLNRDALFGIHPETKGRLTALRSWNPLLFVDAHEMGSQDTFLFSPPREPINQNYSSHTRKWSVPFAEDQAKAFDARGWAYYHGEWNDDWYPGYANAWQQFRGAVSILYEQARVAEGGVRQGNGKVLSYREAVAHQAISSLANLDTLAKNLRPILADYAADRARVTAADGPYAKRSFAILPSNNGGRLRQFLELMALQGIEVYRTTAALTTSATDQLGETRSVELPVGTLVIPNRQPEARLLAAMLEFDPRLPRQVLADERKELLARDDSTMYDWTAWNLTMLFDLAAYTLASDLPANAERVSSLPTLPAAAPVDPAALFLALPGEDDRTVAAAARLLERGLVLRVLDEATTLDGKALTRGSVVAMRRENEPGHVAVFSAVANELGLPVTAVGGGLGAGDLADIGGSHFQLLEAPRVGLIARGAVSTYDFGNLYYVLDQRLGIRHSHLDEASFGGLDLRQYNVLVLPDRGGALSEAMAGALRTWVEQGGTLIAIARSAGQLAREQNNLSAVRSLPSVLGALEPFQVAIHREWEARSGVLADDATLWNRDVPMTPQVPWAGTRIERVDKEEAERRDAWQARFMPQGAILASRVDPEHWLTFGTREVLPVLYAQQPVLLASEAVEAPVRLGTYVPATAAAPTKTAEKAGKAASEDKPKSETARQAGWAPLPAGQDLRLRMSGLLWPEAAQRLASAAYLTRESRGLGQIILFAAQPAQRGGTLGTMRLLENALVFGPGLGAQAPLIP